MIPTRHGKDGQYEVTVPTWSDKLVQEVIRLLLEAYYEPQFSDRSHGFRPGRGCHTALLEITHNWHGTTWFIEGDITDCFGSLDHEILLGILAEKIRDGRFLRLIGGLLQAGYLEDWRYHATLSGCPQGGIASPVLSNVYLDRLDRFIEQDILPAYNRGARRTPYRPYMRLWQQACRLEQRGEREAGRELRRQMKAMPSRDPADPGYRRLKYCRYADDWVLGFTGPRQEAEEVKDTIGQFLREQLKLELSPAKTLITHGRTQAARFLGYEMVVMHADDKRDHRGHRSINAGIGLKVPASVIRAKCAPYLHRGKPVRRTERIVDTDFSVVAQFQAEYRGVAEFYRLAFNRHKLGRLKYVMERSLTKTLARKYRVSVPQVYRRYRAVLDTEHGPRRAFGSRWTGTGNRRWSRNGAASPWHGTPRHGPSTTTPPASGATAPRSSSGSWPTSANCAGRGNRSKCTTSGRSKTSTARGRTLLNGPGGWRHATARPSSSAAHAMRASTAEARHGNHDQHWRAEMLGKRASPVRREAVRKGPFRYLAGGPPYRTPGLEGGCPEKARVHPT